MADFYREIAGLLEREGGYISDPDDPGGETNFGISRKSYPDEDIKNLDHLTAAAIYQRDFWDVLKCGSYRSQKTASVVFDAGVNLGVARAARLLQEIVGAVADGVVGPKTLSKVNGYSDPEKLAAIFTLKRIQFYVSLVTKRARSRKFFRGWVTRTLEVLKIGG